MELEWLNSKIAENCMEAVLVFNEQGDILNDILDFLSSQISSLTNPTNIANAIVSMRNEKVNPANELSEMQKNSLIYTVAAKRMSSLITELKTVINMGNG